MAIFDFVSAIWKRKIQKALYEYEIHDGVANIMPDDPDAYLEQGYAGNTSVYSIINRIDNMRKQAYLKLYRKGTDGKPEEVTDHELIRFLKKVNEDVYTDDLISSFLIYMLTIGEYFVYRHKLSTGINKGKVAALYELPANEVEIIEGNYMEPVRGYRIEGNIRTEFEKQEVYHSKFINPLWHSEGSLHGMSPLRAAAKTVSKLNQLETTELKQLENQGPPYILYREVANSGNAIDMNANGLTDVQRADLIKEIKKSSRDENRRGLPLVVKHKLGRLDLGQKVADIATIESSSSGVIALCAVYGIPPELFGYGQKTYNNMGTARKSAWTDCIMPNLDMVAQMLNACLIDDVETFKDLYFAFDYSDVEELQEGIESKVNWMTRAGWSYNEIREATGKTPHENPLMDEPVIAMGSSFLSDYSGDPDEFNPESDEFNPDNDEDEDGKDFSDYVKHGKQSNGR